LGIPAYANNLMLAGSPGGGGGRGGPCAPRSAPPPHERHLRQSAPATSTAACRPDG
jgi:hypothetical protein